MLFLLYFRDHTGRSIRIRKKILHTLGKTGSGEVVILGYESCHGLKSISISSPLKLMNSACNLRGSQYWHK